MFLWAKRDGEYFESGGWEVGEPDFFGKMFDLEGGIPGSLLFCRNAHPGHWTSFKNSLIRDILEHILLSDAH